MEKEGTVKEVKSREYFEKPSAKRHKHDREIKHKLKKKLIDKSKESGMRRKRKKPD